MDVRRDDEWAEGHIEGAEHLPLDQLAARADELGEGPILFYCAVGERSLMAAQALAGAGPGRGQPGRAASGPGSRPACRPPNNPETIATLGGSHGADVRHP